MLNRINNFEKNYNKPLNKGMVCGNLGVSSLAEGDIDGGIAYLAWAMQEDRAWISGKLGNSIFASPLYAQFAKGTNRGGISQFGRSAPWIMLRTALEKYNNTYKEKIDLAAVLEELENTPEHRALFEGAIWIIHRNLCLLLEENERGIYKDDNNVFTRLRLFDGIIALCRFIELRMKHHELNLKILKKKNLEEIKTKGTLGALLWKIFGRGWYKSIISRIPKFTASKNFDDFLESHLKLRDSHIRSLLLLLVIRNYSVHLCDPKTPFFFKNIRKIFNEIIAAYVYYLKFRKLI